MNRIKEIRNKYGLKKPNGIIIPITQRQIGIMIGKSKSQIGRLENSHKKYGNKLTKSVENSLDNLEKLLRNGDVKIPK